MEVHEDLKENILWSLHAGGGGGSHYPCFHPKAMQSLTKFPETKEMQILVRYHYVNIRS